MCPVNLTSQSLSLLKFGNFISASIIDLLNWISLSYLENMTVDEIGTVTMIAQKWIPGTENIIKIKVKAIRLDQKGANFPINFQNI